MIAVLFLGIGMYLAVYRPQYFVVLYGLTACGKDAYGVLSYLSAQFPYYQLLMNVLLVGTLVLLLLRRRKKGLEQPYFQRQFWLFFLASFLILLSVLIRTLGENLFVVGVFLSQTADYSPIFLLILLGFSDNPRALVRPFWLLLSVQVYLALAVIYMPDFGVRLFERFRSTRYMSADQSVYFEVAKADFRNFFLSFTDKYAFNQLAQFHNTNDSGFYGATAFFVFGYAALQKRPLYKKIALGITASAGALLWANSGMRGPLFGIAAGLIVWYCLIERRIGKKSIALVVISVVFLLFLIHPEWVSFFTENKDVRLSFDSRGIRRENAFSFIAENFLLGSLGRPAPLTLSGADAHELPLYMTALFGVFGGILYTFIVYLLPIGNLWRYRKKTDLYRLVLYFIVVFVSMTNCFTDTVLFWFLLAVSVPVKPYEEPISADAVPKKKKRKIRFV